MKFINKYYQESTLVVLILLSRLPFASHLLINWDAANFALALDKFDMIQHQPHPPGYIIYIFLGRLVNVFFNQANTSFVFLSIIAAIVSAIIFLKFCRLIFQDKFFAWCLSLVVIFNPVFWYYGLIASTYIFDALFSILFAYLAVLIFKTQHIKYLYYFTAVIALAGGFRETLIILFLPLYLYYLIYLIVKHKVGGKTILLNFLLGLLIIICWFGPLLYLSGGWAKYWWSTNLLLSSASQYTSVLKQCTWEFFVLNFKTIVRASLNIINVTIILPLIIVLFANKIKKTNFIKQMLSSWLVYLFLLWLLPSYLLYIFIHFGQLGYLMTVSLAVIVIFYAPLYLLKDRKKILLIISLCLVSGGILSFLFVNSKFFKENDYLKIVTYKLEFFWGTDQTYQSIKESDQQIESYLAEIVKFDPQKTIIIAEKGMTYQKEEKSEPERNLGEYFRQLQYYLPQYQLYDILGSREILFKVKGSYPYEMSVGNLINIADNITTVIVVADNVDYQIKQSSYFREIKLASGYALYLLDITSVRQIEYGGYIIKKWSNN